MNKRKVALVLLSVIAFSVTSAAAMAQSSDAPPSTPGDPKARAYGTTSAGIRWNRSRDDRGAVRGYEVARDGLVLVVRDALSYVDNDLEPGTRYTYTIAAVDSVGQRSTRARVTLTTPDARPIPVAGLRANVYSATAAGLSWTRAAALGTRYEVKRDGQRVATTDGTSYIDRNLGNRRAYLFEVIAVNRQGQRAPAARLFVDTHSGGAPSPGSGPGAPAGLFANAYSSTAGGIAWQRASTPGLRYEVQHDGAVVAEGTATSYVDQSLDGDTSYRYDVTAIDAQGRRSAASSVTLTTPPGGPSPGPVDPPPPNGDNPFASPNPEGLTIISRLGYASARDRADDLVSASYLSLYYDIAADIGELLQSTNIGAPLAIACPGGGNAIGSSNGQFDQTVDFEQCVIGGRVLDGGLIRLQEFSVFGGGSTQLEQLTFNDLQIDAGERVLTVTGSALRSDADVVNTECGGAPTISHSFETEINSATIETVTGNEEIESARWRQNSTSESVTGDDTSGRTCRRVETLDFDGATTVTGIDDSGTPASIEKRGDITRDPSDTAASATSSAALIVDFAADAQLSVTATDDAAGEAQVDIVSDGISVSFTDDYRFEARDDIPSILGEP